MPTISDPRSSPTGITTAWCRYTTDTQAGTFYAWFTTNATETDADIKTNGLSAAFDVDVDSGNNRIRWYSNRPHFYITGLTQGSTYYAHTIQTSGSDSTALHDGPFTLIADSPGTSSTKLTRKAAVTLDTVAGAADAVTNYAKSPDGNHLYMSSRKAGVYHVDISDGDNPVNGGVARFYEGDETTISTMAVRDVKTTTISTNRYLFAIGRRIDFADSNEAGRVCSYDINTVGSPSILESFQLPDDLIYRGGTTYGNNWCQNGVLLSTTLIAMACQYTGLVILDVSTPSAMAVHSTFDLEDMVDALGGSTQTITSGSVISSSSFEATITSHGYSNDDRIFTSAFSELDANRRYATVSSVTANTFRINVDATGYSTGGAVQLAPTGEPLFECSGIAASEDLDWVFLSNHGDGVMAIDVSTTATPTNPQFYDAPTSLLITGGTAGNTINIRIRALETSGDYLYCVANANDSTTSRPERGLCVMPIVDPTAVDQSDWVVYPIGIQDNDLWGTHGIGEPGWGDQINQGLTIYEDRAYVGNGQRGTCVFDISTPTAVVYLGLVGTGITSGTNIYQNFVDRHNNGKLYSYYSGGYQPVPTRTLWVDQVSGTGMTTADLEIGNNPASLTDSQNQPINSSRGRGLSTTLANCVVPADGNSYAIKWMKFLGSQTGANKVPIMGVYGSAGATDGTPVGALLASASLDMGATIDTTLTYEFLLPALVPVAAGNYTCCIIGNASGINVREETTGVHSQTAGSQGGVMMDPYVDGGTSAGALVMWVGLDIVPSGIALTSDLTFDLTSDLTSDLTG